MTSSCEILSESNILTIEVIDCLRLWPSLKPVKEVQHIRGYSEDEGELWKKF